MKKVEKKIALKGQAYVAPRAKSFMITNQGVLCGSGGTGGGAKGMLSGFSKNGI